MSKFKNFIIGKQKAIIVTLAIIGSLLIFLSFSLENTKNTSKKTADTDELSKYGRELEEKLENTLSSLTGEGTIMAMITFSSGFENIYETTAVTNSKNESIFSEVKNNEEPLQIKRKCPKIGGVMLVCDALLDKESLLQIKKATATALNISETKIYVIGGETNYGKNP